MFVSVFTSIKPTAAEIADFNSVLDFEVLKSKLDIKPDL